MRENTAFVISIVRKHIRNPEMVKDLTQEIFIRAFQSYDSYVEQGKIKSWLAMIANNKLKNYYKYGTRYENNVSLDFMPISVPEDNPEDIFIRNEFAERVINIINSLPQIQRDVIMYMYVYNYSIEEVARITNIPEGSVKSAGHYGLEKVKKLIGENETKPIKHTKGKNNMNLTNKEAYALLYEYAKGHVSGEDKTALEEYFKIDTEAANIASALKELHPKLTYAREDEMTHYNITFIVKNGAKLTYSNVSYHIENYKAMNEYLEKHDGSTPPDGHWFEMGSDNLPCATYDNDGNKIEMNVWRPENGNYRTNVKKMKKVFYPTHWRCQVYYQENNTPENKFGIFEKLKDAPNLFKVQTCNYFGSKNPIKSALYIAIPGEATNIRMIRGNGWHDCGTYKFAYTDRYVMGDEGNHAECTFNLE